MTRHKQTRLTEFAVLVSLMFALLPKDQTFQNLFIFAAADIKFRVTAIRRFPLFNHSANLLYRIFSGFFEIIEFI